MNSKIKSFSIILLVMIVSCRHQNAANELPTSENNTIVKKENQEPEFEKAKIDKPKIIDQLQGKWKEHEYPYRTAEFVHSTVKFVEEGTDGKPKFEKFEVSEGCPFENNNISDLRSGDVILTLPETSRCEILMVSNDTLILSGFSTNTNGDYNIIYLKLK